MISLVDLNPFDLEKLSIKDYFKAIESAIGKENNVDRLTIFFTKQPFSETTPYLIRRQLMPIDKKFKKIELVYEDRSKVSAIVWELSLSLSQLIEIFGLPIIHNEPYSNTTAFAFKSTNPNIEIIETRHSEWLKKSKNNSFEYLDKNNQKKELEDPMFSFVQFNISA